MIIHNFRFEEFYETNDGMVEPACELIYLWKEAGKAVKNIRCDNAEI